MNATDEFDLSQADQIKNAILLGGSVHLDAISDILGVSKARVKQFSKWLEAGVFSEENLENAADADFQQTLIDELDVDPDDVEIRTTISEIERYLTEIVRSEVLETRPKYEDFLNQYSSKQITANALLIDRDVRDVTNIQIAQVLQVTPTYISTIKIRIEDDSSIDAFRDDTLLAKLDKILDEISGVKEVDLADTLLRNISLPEGVSTRGDILANLFTVYDTLDAKKAAGYVRCSEPYAQQVKNDVDEDLQNYEFSNQLQADLRSELNEEVEVSEIADRSHEVASVENIEEADDSISSLSSSQSLSNDEKFDVVNGSSHLDQHQVQELLEKTRQYYTTAQEEEKIFSGNDQAEARGKRKAAQIFENWLINASQGE